MEGNDSSQPLTLPWKIWRFFYGALAVKTVYDGWKFLNNLGDAAGWLSGATVSDLLGALTTASTYDLRTIINIALAIALVVLASWDIAAHRAKLSANIAAGFSRAYNGLQGTELWLLRTANGQAVLSFLTGTVFAGFVMAAFYSDSRQGSFWWTVAASAAFFAVLSSATWLRSPPTPEVAAVVGGSEVDKPALPHRHETTQNPKSLAFQAARYKESIGEEKASVLGMAAADQILRLTPYLSSLSEEEKYLHRLTGSIGVLEERANTPVFDAGGLIPWYASFFEERNVIEMALPDEAPAVFLIHEEHLSSLELEKDDPLYKEKHAMLIDIVRSYIAALNVVESARTAAK